MRIYIYQDYFQYEIEFILFVEGWESCKFSPLEMSVAQMSDMEIRYQYEPNN